MQPASRIELARRRLVSARRGVVAGSIGLFAFALVAARVSHPATATHPATAVPASVTSSDHESDDGFWDEDGGGSFGPSQGGAPQVQSGGS